MSERGGLLRSVCVQRVPLGRHLFRFCGVVLVRWARAVCLGLCGRPRSRQPRGPHHLQEKEGKGGHRLCDGRLLVYGGFLSAIEDSSRSHSGSTRHSSSVRSADALPWRSDPRVSMTADSRTVVTARGLHSINRSCHSFYPPPPLVQAAPLSKLQ